MPISQPYLAENQQHALRGLRLYHYIQSKCLREAFNDRRLTPEKQQRMQELMAFHEAAVRALNACFKQGDWSRRDFDASPMWHRGRYVREKFLPLLDPSQQAATIDP